MIEQTALTVTVIIVIIIMTEMSTIESDVLLAVLNITPSFVVVLKIESISIVDSLGTNIRIEVKRLLDSSKLVGNEDMDIINIGSGSWYDTNRSTC